ncbi:Hydroxysteroid dehydrogenase-like protein 2 [Intoshia linei]|uniref:Hydroxysteroid dehydrogenase-like protein 2 n=1 Tax=Intoshia linei TaxID=1819745 RepID=A0A177B4X4_9BILA|nr:Hydroxysteroid dehydrogenase-like protein 2 [Intoshia linei]
MKQYDLMNSVNARGTYLMSKYCINHMKKSKNAHILNLSPPINLNPVWLKNHAAYTLSKYGMSMFTIAMSHELRPFSIKVNSLWPQTAIYTAAMERLGGGDGVKKFCRSSEILCDAVEEIFKDGSDKNSGNLYIDEELLRKKGHIDFEKYSLGDATLLTDFFIGDSVPTDFSVKKDVNIQKIVEKVAKSINNDMIQQVGAKFIVDFGETKYILDLKKNGTFQEKQKNEESTDATLKISAEDFSNIMSGKSSAMDAYVSGRLHIEGDIECAMKLANVINK